MSGLSIAAYFPWRRMKAVYHNHIVESRSALVRLEPDRRFRPLCHACGRVARAVHARTRKFVRDLSFGGSSMLLHVEHRKVRCAHCRSVRVEKLDFVDPHQRVTHRLGAYAAELCSIGLSVDAVARHLDLDPKTVKRFDKAALQAQVGRTSYEGLCRLAIDEIAVRKGFHYMTVVLDYDTGRVVWMAEGRQAATLDRFFAEMPISQRSEIQAVAIDMWDPYIRSIKEWCPNADIVFDHFHVVKAFNQVIDRVRNEEFQNADDTGRETLKGSKYLFLKNWGKLDRKQRVRLNEILAMNERLNTLYWLKDLLAHIWSYQRCGWARKVLDQWCAVAREDGHPSLATFARRLERYRYGILNHCRHPMNTGRLEGANNKIKVIKRVAFGFHDLEYFALKVKQAFPGRPASN